MPLSWLKISFSSLTWKDRRKAAWNASPYFPYILNLIPASTPTHPARIMLPSVATPLMGVFSCLAYISPCSHPGSICFHIWGINADINELKTDVFMLKGQTFLVPSALLRDLRSSLSPFIHALTGPTTPQKALANFLQKDTELLPNVPLHNRLYLMGLWRLGCHTLPHTLFVNIQCSSC